jgi:hypothetical protein
MNFLELSLSQNKVGAIHDTLRCLGTPVTEEEPYCTPGSIVCDRRPHLDGSVMTVSTYEVILGVYNALAPYRLS